MRFYFIKSFISIFSNVPFDSLLLFVIEFESFDLKYFLMNGARSNGSTLLESSNPKKMLKMKEAKQVIAAPKGE